MATSESASVFGSAKRSTLAVALGSSGCLGRFKNAENVGGIHSHVLAHGDFKHGCQKGSGGLWNNPADSPGKWPLERADMPIGQWNTTRVRMQGEHVTVILDDNAPLVPNVGIVAGSRATLIIGDFSVSNLVIQ